MNDTEHQVLQAQPPKPDDDVKARHIAAAMAVHEFIGGHPHTRRHHFECSKHKKVLDKKMPAP